MTRSQNRCHPERRADEFDRLGAKDPAATRETAPMARLVARDTDSSLRADEVHRPCAQNDNG
jgi:hypothetical protein